MLTLSEVFCSTAPVCSATFMNRLLNSSSSTGSGLVAAGGDARRARFGPPQQQVIELGDLGASSRARRPWWRWPRGSAPVRRCGRPPADPYGRTPGRHARRRRSTSRSVSTAPGAPPSRRASARLADRLAGGDRLDRHRLDDQRPSGVAKPNRARCAAVNVGTISPARRRARSTPPSVPA